jgi:hypothetical protein
MGESLKRCGWRYFNYYPETKSVTDGHDDPHIPPPPHRLLSSRGIINQTVAMSWTGNLPIFYIDSYIINHVSSETLTTGWMISSGTNSPPALSSFGLHMSRMVLVL